ncbi:Uma2 family endonuclease [Methylobacter sp. G7]|uniref:Uma2 family endonuclease n=1 Tax=Methylobacter sp. G7 TaxID=3230117 RepID=UPI003D806182
MPKITHLSQLDLNKTYSYADYLTWQFDETVELIKGKIMLMSPAPNVKHQDISMNLTRSLSVFFKHKKCRVYAAPFDVRLYDRKKSILANKEIHTVVQPDLCVICDTQKLDEQGCNGAPDWIIEILSKGNSKKEMQIKYGLYAESGVTEYWLVYPYEQAVYQFVLDDNGRYQLKDMYANNGMAIPHLFPELTIDLSEVFESFGDE